MFGSVTSVITLFEWGCILELLRNGFIRASETRGCCCGKHQSTICAEQCHVRVSNETIEEEKARAGSTNFEK